MIENLDKNLKIAYNQTGFRKNFRTADNVFTLRTIIDHKLSNKKKLYTCFVDFKKAFDTVSRNALLYKILAMGISNKYVKLIKSMYSTLSAQVSLPNGLSKEFPSLLGVKQGCNLSPTLFNIFINDLISDCNVADSDSPKIDGLEVSCILYADYLVLISNSKLGLQKLLDTLEKFCTKWHMKINLSKTKVLIFGKRRTRVEPFFLGKSLISYCEQYVFLGTTFTWNGSFKNAMITKSISCQFQFKKEHYKIQAL